MVPSIYQVVQHKTYRIQGSGWIIDVERVCVCVCVCVCEDQMYVPLSWLALNLLRGGSITIASPVIYDVCLARHSNLYSLKKSKQVCAWMAGCWFRLPSNSVWDQPVMTWPSQDASDWWSLSWSTHSQVKVSQIDDAQLPHRSDAEGWLGSKVKRLVGWHCRGIWRSSDMFTCLKLRLFSTQVSFFFFLERDTPQFEF